MNDNKNEKSKNTSNCTDSIVNKGANMSSSNSTQAKSQKQKSEKSCKNNPSDCN